MCEIFRSLGKRSNASDFQAKSHVREWRRIERKWADIFYAPVGQSIDVQCERIEEKCLALRSSTQTTPVDFVSNVDCFSLSENVRKRKSFGSSRFRRKGWKIPEQISPLYVISWKCLLPFGVVDVPSFKEFWNRFLPECNCFKEKMNFVIIRNSTDPILIPKMDQISHLTPYFRKHFKGCYSINIADEMDY